MKIIKGITFAAVMLGVATSTFAAKNSFYFGGQLGYSDSDYSASNQNLVNADVSFVDNTGSRLISTPLGTAKTSTDQDHLGGRVYLGYQFNKHFALESGYTQFGKTEVNNAYGLTSNRYINHDVDLNNAAIDLVAKGMLPVGHKFDLFAKGGVAYVDADTIDRPALVSFSHTSSPFIVSNSASVTSYHEETTTKLLPTAGVGAEYTINPRLSMDLSYSIIPGSGDIKTSQLVALGLAFHV